MTRVLSIGVERWTDCCGNQRPGCCTEQSFCLILGEAGAKGHPLCANLINHVRGSMCVGVYDQPRAGMPGHSRYAAVGPAVTAARRELQGHPVGGRQRRILFRDETRMRQNVNIGTLNSGTIGAGCDRLDRSFAVDNDEPSAEAPGTSRKASNLGRRNMRYLHAGDERHAEPCGALGAEALKLSHKLVEVLGIRVVRDR